MPPALHGGGIVKRAIYDCGAIGGCGKKNVRLMDTEDGTFCVNCGGEAFDRNGPGEMALWRMAMADREKRR
jgi:hypothetical protein